MHIQLLLLVGVALLLSVLQLCNCSNISQYTKCSKNFECGNEAYSYPFWGGERPFYCGENVFELGCRNSHTEIKMYDATYIVLNISKADQIMTIVRSDVRDIGLGSSQCPSAFLNDSLATSYKHDYVPQDTFAYGSGTRELTLFYGCPFVVLYNSGGFRCEDQVNSTRINLYLQAESGPREENLNTSKCQGSILIPVRPSSAHRSSIDILADGFDVKYYDRYYSLCVNCTESGGSCGASENRDNSFHCYCHDGTSQRTCPPPGTYIHSVS
ncbi:hypothetical protein GIB67_018107 [Kingdonia uniflora]|uniref:LEAF RUST 10 DISEASE-RESISTANCE LOCUS RECEPTOR-LIKE PROTEIN KINASE-like 1.2 n=1 Tax=Kingdonia uniflora TaxID=39325 RepID=A0A7J7NWV7_9MAGN|nr:hypothetical protein GIB67_018107 [Kingdonia uniflora]